MTRICTLIAVGLSIAALPCAAQDVPPAIDAERDAVSPQVETTPPAPAATNESPTQPAPRSERFQTVDRIELDSTAITGNRELPKVLYIVPWKKADMGDLIGRPANSLIDEVLAPVDREVFRRQNEYFTKVNADASASQPPEPAP
jgi:hypothetical protein